MSASHRVATRVLFLSSSPFIVAIMLAAIGC